MTIIKKFSPHLEDYKKKIMSIKKLQAGKPSLVTAKLELSHKAITGDRKA